MTCNLLAALFIDWIPITGAGRLGMLLPLALSVSIVYRTIRCERLAAIPLASLVLWITIVAGMMLIGLVLLVVFHLLA